MNHDISNATLCRKISIAKVYGTIKEETEGPLMEVFGTCKKYEMVATPFDSTAPKFIGEFLAINLATGEMFRSRNAYFPAVYAELLQSLLDDIDDVTANVEVAIQFIIKRDPKDKKDYIYDAKPLGKMEVSSPIVDLMNKYATKKLDNPAKKLDKPMAAVK